MECKKCKIDKDISKFYKNKRMKNGHLSTCRECCKRYYRKYCKMYRKKESNIKYMKEYRKKYDFYPSIKKYHYNKLKTNSAYKILCNLRIRLNYVIKLKSRAGSAVRDLGCDGEFLKKYLENKFLDGMSWKNYGEWHIDHIIPLSSFNLEDREQFLKACHYTNLQPLWAKDNRIKSNKLII